MIGTSNLNAIKAQNQINNGRNFNPGHYIQKQKEAQIVRIKSSDSMVPMKLSGIIPDFQNIGESLGLNANDVFYQIKSFRSSNRFHNVKSTDGVIITTKVTYMQTVEVADGDYKDYDSYEGNGFNTAPIYVPLQDMSYNTDLIVNASELADMFTKSIIKEVIEQEHIYGSASVPTLDIQYLNQANLACLFDTGRLVVKNAKLTYVNQYQTNVNQADILRGRYLKYLSTLPVALLQKDLYISKATIIIKPDPSASEATKKRIASLLGMTNKDEQGSYVLQMVLDDYFTDRVVQTEFFRSRNTPILPNYQFDILEATTIGGPMNIYPYESIVIRSSLQSNLWNQDGRKSNIIAVIPLLGGIDTLAIEYQPAASTQRTYNIRDSLNSFHNFTIDITDEDGVPIHFLDEYELEIAVFFTNKDPIMETF